MAILTPITLWQDFDDSLPLNEEIISERREDGIVWRDLYFYGRNVGEAGRVKIYARYVFPEDEEKFPAVMILFEAGHPFDEQLVLRYVRGGYGVLCVDYSGERDEGEYTVYPKAISYANLRTAGRSIDYCDRTAKETSWYEWAAVARYAVNFLSSREEVQAIGAVGLRTGGEVLFKIAPYSPLACMISVCAAGWLAYRGISKFSAEDNRILDEERHRFIAGIDSQSYAPHVKCPVLLVSAINDKKYNYVRVYDTFRQINPNTEKAILFSAHGSGLVGSHALKDIDLFLDKYLRGRSVFLSRPISLDVQEDEEGNLMATGTFDPAGEIKEFGIFYTESVLGPRMRDWTRVYGKPEDLDGNVGTVPLPLYQGSKKALVYAFVNYSNNLSVTSKILEVNVEKKYKNACPKSRVIYSESEKRNGFSTFWRRTHSIADCFSDGANSSVRQLAGFGGIKGIATTPGVISYRVGEERYEAPEGASFRFDAYAASDATLRVVFYKDEEEEVGFSGEVQIAGGGGWKSVLFDPTDFKSDTGAPLQDFHGVVSVVFMSDEDVLINNVLWI